MENKNFPTLFSPLGIGNFTVKNRIAMAPTDISSANADGSVNQRVITFHEEVAKGGTGFIIVGASTPDKATGRPTATCIALDEDPLIPGLASLAEGMHRHGARCAVQIQHPGRQAAWPRKGLFSATDMVAHLPGSAGHEVVYADSFAQGKSIRELSIEEIYDLIEKFGEAAWRCQQAGFDAVELHGAHGYLIAQFMTPFVNKRNDRFGGTFIDRMRFPLEIIDRIKLKCGPDYPVGIRYSAVEYVDGGRELEESVRIAELMEKHGAAWIDVSMGIFEAPGPTMDPMYYPQGWATFAAEEMKKTVHIPIITTHSLRDPKFCEQILAEGKADMVGLSRQLVADQYWANKAARGESENIRKCISCLVGCWQESLMIKREMRCAINPAVGDERFIHVEPAKKVYQVAVVGGGPAGMEAARLAAIRGHKVTIFEKSKELGGAILYCCTVPGFAKMKWYADWERRQIAKLGVEVKYGTEPGIKDLKAFDVVLVASGAKNVKPDIPGINNDFVLAYQDVLRCTTKSCEYWPEGGKEPPVETGDTVLIWGDYFGTINAAEKLGQKGKKVYIVTENKEFAEWYDPVHRDVMMKRFNGNNGEGLNMKAFAHPVTFLNNSTVVEIGTKGDVIVMDSAFNRTTVKVDNVVLSLVERDESVYQDCLKEGIPVQEIGDAHFVKNLRHAVFEGANAALTLDEDLTLNANRTLVSNLPTDDRMK
ncbi:MAG: FAD-dependent oxidoreductase [Spirochaetales bacterium]|nr:FAD-dependent oxidoreductase [Spirochaetales bacterium]